MNNLYVVATPIGNLEDISKRSIKTFQKSSLIITEKQNKTKKLLKLLEIDFSKKYFFTYGDFNNKESVKKVIEHIKRNKHSLLTCEAGTPLISDPGYKIISYIRENKLNIDLQSIPGPSAITTHLSISGLPTDKFMFLGFLPKSKSKKTKEIKKLEEINNNLKTTFVIYESKYRIIETLKTINNLYPKSKVSIGQELTKMNETVHFGNTNDIVKEMEQKDLKGEFVIHLKIN